MTTDQAIEVAKVAMSAVLQDAAHVDSFPSHALFGTWFLTVKERVETLAGGSAHE